MAQKMYLPISSGKPARIRINYLSMLLKLSCCLLLLVLSACNINNGSALSAEQEYILTTFNGTPVTAGKEASLLGGMITLYKDGSIERKIDHRMQDGSDSQEFKEGTYELKGVDLNIAFKEPSGYVWTPKATLKGDTLTFYNPCVACFGPPHVEVFVRR